MRKSDRIALTIIFLSWGRIDSSISTPFYSHLYNGLFEVPSPTLIFFFSSVRFFASPYLAGGRFRKEKLFLTSDVSVGVTMLIVPSN